MIVRGGVCLQNHAGFCTYLSIMDIGGSNNVRMLQAESIRDKYTGGTKKTLVVRKDSIDE